MKRIGALTIAVAMTVAACGGSNDTVAEPDVEVEAVDDDGAFRLAAGDVQVINGCRIEPNTRCPGANLYFVDLERADLRYANLYGAFLSDTNLTGTDLRWANLADAIMWSTNLTGADLRFANLSGAMLAGANLSGANLSGADLSGANLAGAKFCRTTMPDGTVRNDDC